MKNNKTQIWSIDYVIGLVIFVMTLVLAFTLTENILTEKEDQTEMLLTDAKIISQMMITSGYPTDWNSTTAKNLSEGVKIGLGNKPNFLNDSKIIELNQTDYYKIKLLLGTKYDFFFYFQDKDGEIKNIRGICGVGEPTVFINTTSKRIGYYNSSESLLGPYIEKTGADIYSNNNVSFVDNLASYSIFVLENPNWNNLTLTAAVEQYVQNGGILFLSQGLENSLITNFADVVINKTNISIKLNSTIINYDPLLDVYPGINITFSNSVFVYPTSSASDYISIAIFQRIDNYSSIATWNYGIGKVFYFSDFDNSYTIDTLNDEIIRAIKKQAFLCGKLNTTGITVKSIIRFSRFVIYDSEILKMEALLWTN